MSLKTALFSHLTQARDYLRYIGLSIQQACEHDRFLLTLPNVVSLLLETSEGRKWIINEHEKIINDLEHKYQTRGIEGFVYEGGLFRWVWWKLFGNEEQYYTSGYQNRIAEIVAHIKEENKEKGTKEKDAKTEQEKLEQEQKDKSNDAQAPGKKNEKKQLLKSQESYERLVREHEKKLKDYIENSGAYDNKGLLEKASNSQKQQIINGQANALRRQIQKQQGELDKINNQLRNI